MRISDWSSDVCSSDLKFARGFPPPHRHSRRCVRAGSVWRVTAGTPCRRAGRDRAGLAFELRTHHACSALSEGAQPLHGRLRDHRPVELPSEPGTARISIGGSSRDRLHERLILIGGSGYAGEMKNAVFTVLNLVMPPQGVMPMHCSANIGADEGREGNEWVSTCISW